jgi:dihydroxyacid dehydratase/phosphogluconate dehydratase
MQIGVTFPQNEIGADPASVGIEARLSASDGDLDEWIKQTEPAPSYTSGVFAKYAAMVSSASEGAITRVQL